MIISILLIYLFLEILWYIYYLYFKYKIQKIILNKQNNLNKIKYSNYNQLYKYIIIFYTIAQLKRRLKAQIRYKNLVITHRIMGMKFYKA